MSNGAASLDLLSSDHKPEKIRRASGALAPAAAPGAYPEGDALIGEASERELLLSRGWPSAVVAELEEEASEAGVGLIQAAIAGGFIDASEFYGALSQRLSLAESDPPPYRIDMPSPPSKTWSMIARPLAVPVKSGAGAAVSAAVNAQALPVPMLAALAAKLGPQRGWLRLLTRQAVIDSITHSFGQALVSRAVSGLLKRKPEWSAKSGLALWQSLAATILSGLFVGAFAVAPRETLNLASLFLSLFFMGSIGLRALAAINLLLPQPEARLDRAPLLADIDLPRYTVFVPLFREADILPHLSRALADLDYPAAKLDIKIVLESIDEETIETARRLPFQGNVDFIVVPDRQPRTKPKALNYALQFATGELAVIFDAEDRPEPDQLRKAASVFHHAPPDLACLQARLDYFNANENWLSRQFTIEYAALFRGVLPLLSRFGLPLPLGGTSNHFRVSVLRKLHAWDPFNVTEDADLGMRLSRAGYRVETLDSTTYEEACCHTVAWVKQRTRWLKGWMQTFGVHMRRPWTMLRETGLAGFLAFQAYFAGIIVSSLVHPVFYAAIAHDAASGALFAAKTPADKLVLGLALFNFTGGYIANLALGVLSLRGSRHKGLALHALFIPIYWLFVSAAAYRAAWQLARAPFYWEKTAHGVSATLKAAGTP